MTRPMHAHLIEQAGWNRTLGSPFTADLLLKFAQDFDAGGPIAVICSDWDGNPRKDAVGLRVLGALHHAALTGASPELAAAFPAANPGASADDVWPIARDWLSENLGRVRVFMQSPPQTNETRRSIALLPGFLSLADRFDMPMDLLELGASAGLNQYWDKFEYETDDWSRAGDSHVSISTEWDGPAPTHLDAQPLVRSRAACDLSPLDVSDPEQADRLKAYTWPDQAERLARLDAAIDLAIDHDTQIDEADAETWLTEKLARRAPSGLTVIYHSIFLIYPPKEQIARIMALIENAGAEATDKAPLAWLCYESEALFGGDRGTPNMYTRLQTWPGGEVQMLAKSDGHVTRVESLADS